MPSAVTRAGGDVHRACRDPGIVGVDAVGEWVPDFSTRRPHLRDGRYQRVGDRHNRGFGGRHLDPPAPGRAPLGDDRAIAQLGQSGFGLV